MRSKAGISQATCIGLISVGLGKLPWGLTDYFKGILAREGRKSSQILWADNLRIKIVIFHTFAIKKPSPDAGQIGPEASFSFILS